ASRGGGLEPGAPAGAIGAGEPLSRAAADPRLAGTAAGGLRGGLERGGAAAQADSCVGGCSRYHCSRASATRGLASVSGAAPQRLTLSLRPAPASSSRRTVER